MENISYSKSISIRHDVDVFIAGGGPAGVAAGVAAARQGKSVFIAEAFGAFGGAGVSMLVPAFMQFTDGINFISAGIGKEVYDYLETQSPDSYKKYCPNSIPVETLKLCYDDMIEKAGVGHIFHTTVVDANVVDGEIRYVVCAAKNAEGEALFAVRAKVYIDCTGDADLAVYAGAETEYGDENGNVMATTLCGIWAGIDWDRVEKPDGRRLEDAFADKVFTNEDRHLPGMWRLAKITEGNGLGGSNAGHIYDVNGGDAEDLTWAIEAGRKQLLEYRKYFREYLDGYENAELVYSAPWMGIRESRRIVCDYRMVLDDFVRRADFDDEIGRFSYNVDIHSPTNDKAGYEKFASEHAGYRYKQGESYGIPYRALAVKGLKNLLTAGRCVGTDRHMQSSIRVMPGCYITGQAAGIAAAIAADGDHDIHAIDVKELQKRLVEFGAYLPNYKG